MSDVGQGAQRGFSQVQAAKYLGVSVRWFRDNVDVEPVPYGDRPAGARPLLRYMREDLDVVLESWKRKRRTA